MATINVFNESTGRFEELKPGKQPTPTQLAEFSTSDRFNYDRRLDDERLQAAQEGVARRKAAGRAQHAAALQQMHERSERDKAKKKARAEEVEILVAETDQSRLVGTERAEQLKTWARLRKEGRTL